MKNKWYRSNLVKAILVILEHIFAVFMIASILCVLAYPVFAEELFTGRSSDTYEDSLVFEESFKRYSAKAVQGIGVQKIWETDGKYDPDKIVDIEEYWKENQVSGKNVSGLAYHLEELIKWDLEINSYESDDEYIIVCETPEGKYKYYTYAEFAVLIDNGEFRLNGYLGEDLFYYLDEMGDTGKNFLQIQDQDGKTIFVNCWKYDGTYVAEKYKTVDGKSILELVNQDERWNGRLQDACDMLCNTVNNLRETEYTYWEAVDNLKEGDTNFTFLYVDKETGETDSNHAEYKDSQNVDSYIAEMKKSGRYVVVESQLDGFQTDMADADADQWRSTVKYAGNSETDFLFAAGVDTKYPIQDSLYTEKQIYEKYSSLTKTIMILGIICSVLWIAGFVWLTVIAGKNPDDDEVKLCFFDKWKTEIGALLTIICCVVPAVAATVLFADSVVSRSYTYELLNYNPQYPLAVAASTGIFVLAFAVFLTGYLSLIRRIKAKTLWKNSILKRIAGFVVHILNHINSIWKTFLIFAVFAGSHFLALIFAYSGGGFISFTLVFIIDAFVGVYLVIYSIGKEKIVQGIKHIAQGEVEYKISTERMLPDHKRIAETVNEIGSGLDAAVEKSMRSERLKTDLITNVSHDIKTPLTSIINYIDLLKKENIQDTKIQHYIEVLEQKAQRLKVLTEDVVEASKVSSGNVTLEYMRINFVEMIQQTSGEFEEKFKKRGLQEILKLPEEEVIIRVDGRRTWRILENIYNNAAKYAMEGSRIYADLKVAEGKAVFELKNISEQPLNISAEELTERFIRGDISRSTEGSGLGLSIARSLTEMQGGRFELYLDGDLFKVTIEFDVK